MKKLKHIRAIKDKIHVNSRRMDSYNKKYNYMVGPRVLGKSTMIWAVKAYKIFRKTGRPIIAIRRNVVDITDTYVSSIAKVINKFLPEEKMLKFDYKKSDSDGSTDVYVNGQIFIRIHALSVPEGRQKSLMLENPALFVFDEFIVNTANGEKYLKNEVQRFRSLYTTYARESEGMLKCWFLGNPYSIFNPYWAELTPVDFSAIRPGCFVVGRDYVIQCPVISEELKQWCIDHGIWDPEVDDEYNRYAFGGEAVNDAHIVINSKQPEGYKLKYVFTIQGKYVAVFVDDRSRPSIGYDVGRFWCRYIKPAEFSSSRRVYAVDFNNLVSGSRLITTDQKALCWRLKECISKRDISYQDVSVGYLVEELYRAI